MARQSSRRIKREAKSMREKLSSARLEIMRAKYDAAQTYTGNELHWSNADMLDPHNAASLAVRQRLRSRSRYEVIENNPFLKGIILTISNDFVGTGPKLRITDKRIPKDRRTTIEKRWREWSHIRRIRQKLWRSRMAKIVDGETFLRSYINTRTPYPVKLDVQVLEADRVSHETVFGLDTSKAFVSEVDGVRFDPFENPESYHILKVHPGSGVLTSGSSLKSVGNWVDAKQIIHWFRQDRGWMRGIPELTPSLPLCAILRRYSTAVLRHAEIAADFAGFIQSQGPPNEADVWNDGDGNLLEDEPFGTFPIESGMITNLPWGYEFKQLNAVPFGVQYDEYVGSILREIVRPILVPYNLSVGTTKDSNMASSIVDNEVYKGGQKFERLSCNEVVLDKLLDLWWFEAVRVTSYLGDDLLAGDESFRNNPPEHSWRWDSIGIDHTDPAKVATALKTLKDSGFITDRDIQEDHMDRSLEEWQEEIAEDVAFRKALFPEEMSDDEDDNDTKPKPKKKTKAKPTKEPASVA